MTTECIPAARTLRTIAPDKIKQNNNNNVKWESECGTQRESFPGPTHSHIYTHGAQHGELLDFFFRFISFLFTAFVLLFFFFCCLPSYCQSVCVCFHPLCAVQCALMVWKSCRRVWSSQLLVVGSNGDNGRHKQLQHTRAKPKTNNNIIKIQKKRRKTIASPVASDCVVYIL